MEDRESRAVGSPSRQGSDARCTDRAEQPMRSGIRSGEICVRIRGHELCADGGAACGLADGLRALAIEPPTLQQMMAPWERKVESLRQKWSQIQERRRLVRQRYEACSSSFDALVSEPAELVDRDCKEKVMLDGHISAYHTLERLYAKYALSAVLQYYAVLEEERAWLAAWRRKEVAACRDLVRVTKRRHHLTSFAVHLESETSSQIRVWRLPDGDAQRARCVKAASENLKHGFFQDPTTIRIQVSDVYKVENTLLLRAFENRLRQSAAGESKIKGLFCCVPPECLERCVVWGMFGDEAELASASGSVDQQSVFNRPSARPQTNSLGREDAPGTGTRHVASQRVQEASPMAFPRRFSRYSTLDELRDLPSSDVEMTEPPTRYLALCRVAMGKTQRVMSRPTDGIDPPFPATASVGSLFYPEDEEYVLRYAEAVVPEFIIEYRFSKVNVDQADRGETDTATHRTLPVRLSQRNEPPPTMLFDTAAQHVLHSLRQGENAAASSQAISLFAENATSPSVFGSAWPRAPRKHHSHRDIVSSENALEVFASRRRFYMDELQHMRHQVWMHAKCAWDELHGSTKRDRPQDHVILSNEPHKKNHLVDRSEPGKTQSRKARKLYSELALVRQLQEQDVARLEALVKPKTKHNANAMANKKAGSSKPRPFR